MWDVFWNNMEHVMVSLVWCWNMADVEGIPCWIPWEGGEISADSETPRWWPVWSISHPTWSLFCKIGRKIWASSMALNSWSQRKMPAICAVKKLKILSSNFCSRLDHLGSVILPSTKQSDCLLLWDVQRKLMNYEVGCKVVGFAMTPFYFSQSYPCLQTLLCVEAKLFFDGSACHHWISLNHQIRNHIHHPTSNHPYLINTHLGYAG